MTRLFVEQPQLHLSTTLLHSKVEELILSGKGQYVGESQEEVNASEVVKCNVQCSSRVHLYWCYYPPTLRG